MPVCLCVYLCVATKLNKTIPDFHFDLQGAGEAFEDMKQMGLSGARPLGEVKCFLPT